ncbi:YqiA/YcfP family alpha/beta fold hydrolase [Leptolyngbya sp. AN02str]|uniref:YqiA/YcfP family alpha/beta fold hydrolase n=1 Tax=Leptolyngbya sp. AN02str TaxID=3423363 RepID=UPI003D318CA6
MSFIYLHGFASSPKSAKAVYLGDRFQLLQQPLLIPDLNQGDFSHLTLSRQMQQVAELFSPLEPVTLIGSSLGGLTAAWLGDRHAQVQRLVLLAPAFGFAANWLARLGEAQVQQWQQTGYMPVYHYSEGRSLPLHYNFLADAQQYDDTQLQRSVPTLILHGIHDEVIPVEASRAYAATRPWVKLVELDSDHALGNVQAEIWQHIQTFCDLT